MIVPWKITDFVSVAAIFLSSRRIEFVEEKYELLLLFLSGASILKRSVDCLKSSWKELDGTGGLVNPYGMAVESC